MKIIGLAIALLLALALPARAQWASEFKEEKRSPFMERHGLAEAPYGFVQFCARMPSECQPGPVERERFRLTPERWRELDEVNLAVNREIEPASDLEVYGMSEYWTIPTTRGDCEDYALLKRKRLIERGWPASSLVMTVVNDTRGEGHAVLTARVLEGDFILDNKVDEVKIWHTTGYHFRTRQSFVNPVVWVALSPADVASGPTLVAIRPAQR